MIKSYNYKDFKIEILYEDSYIAILNKPSGLLTHKKNGLDNSPSLQESLKEQIDEYDEHLYDLLVPYVKDQEGAYEELQEFIHDRHANDWIDS